RRDTKEWLENLWLKYQPYAEPKFLNKIRRESFHAHSWSMYIGTVLLEKGIELEPNSGVGPDLKVKFKNGNLWIEAAVTTSGEDKQTEGLPPSGDIYKGLDPRVARITNSFTKKYRKFKKNYEGKIVKEDEPFIIAINGTYTGTLMGSRAIEAAVFGRGNDLLKRNSNGKLQGGFYEPRQTIEIQKDGKSVKISTDYFCQDSCKEISAVIYCEDHIINSNNYGRKFGENLYAVFNGYAKNKIYFDDFPIGKAVIRDEQGGIIRKN
ncbi:MAG: hypothetical protein ABIF80_01700, partial [Patescibacteria group bacterium]